MGLAEALELLRSGEAEGLIVYRLDRLARDLVLQEQLLAEIWRMGAEVFSTSGAGYAGFGSPLFGYRPEGAALVPHSDEQVTLARIGALHDGGHSLRDIARALDNED